MREICDIIARGAPAGGDSVLVTIAEAEGSTPRAAGTAMLVGASESFGSIGGGHLEYKAIEIARDMLGTSGHRLRRFPLGPALGQCCGGRATLLFEPLSGPGERAGLEAVAKATEPAVLITLATAGEASRKFVVTAAGTVGSGGETQEENRAIRDARAMLRQGSEAVRLREFGDSRVALHQRIDPADFTVVVFGAGHVGRAVVAVLAGLPCRIVWIDGREEAFPARLPANLQREVSEAPEYDVDEAPPGSYYLVMTHSHQLDLRLAERILKRGDFRYFGLIGSTTKRKRFEKRLLQRGISNDVLRRMACPIGISGIPGKHPAEIAVAVAAEILRVRANREADGKEGEGENLSA
jgi:xanthine dehydrogenase accessory factor